ncbi:MAG: HAMP domain-containing histidine kinase [Bacteroidetes Order II. Incertae sedis bacterium]|nr:HAMP domain-containing histidine kinase [Bacteroidetes Order II. bacterium]
MKQEITAHKAPPIDQTLLPALLKAMDTVVFERRKLGNFVVVSEVPEWFPRLYPNFEQYLQNHQLGQLSPVLDNFLIDAERLWQTHTHQQLQSGVWEETDGQDDDYFLEATALFVQNRRILLLRSMGSTFAERQMLLQKAREHTLEYRRVRDEMEQKDVLLHTIVHDMSGPLAGLKGYLDLLGKESLSANGREFIEICQRQAARLDKLVLEILDSFSAELDSGDFAAPTPNEAPDMLVITLDVIKSVLSTALLNKVNLLLDPETDQEINWKVNADKLRLERVMFNLIGNALWHSSEGGTVLVRMTDVGKNIRVQIEDEGPGIRPDLVEVVFQKFQQGKERRGKLGLGLYFCKITVEHWGGKIGYLPREGGGSVFWFELPRPALF